MHITRLFLRVFPVALGLALCGCVESQLLSYKNPDCPKPEFRTVLIRLNDCPPDKEKDIFQAIRANLEAQSRWQVINADSILDPNKLYSRNDAYKEILGSGVQAVLEVRALSQGDELAANSGPDPLALRLELIDVKTANVVWTAQLVVQAGPTAGPFATKLMVNAGAYRIVKDLAGKKILD